MKKFFRPSEYFMAKTIPEVMLLLEKYGEKAKVVAGGSDLFVKKDPEIEQLIDITGLGLDYVKIDDDVMKIGAGTTLREIETSSILKKGVYKVVAEAAHQIGSVQIRHVATIGGNICNAAPSADIPPPLIALDAQAKIVSPTQERVVPLEEFFLGPGKTTLGYNELLTEIRIPPEPACSTVAFLKIRRTAHDIALVNASVRVTLKSGSTVCDDARIVLGAVAPTPMRAKKAEELLRGKTVEDNLIKETAQVAANETKPISDVRASAYYRREMSQVLVRHALEQTIKSVD